tara:strand:+ start:344 stop:532 length:189 start_codon:yes stop_codon:yes gene_type:complete
MIKEFEINDILKAVNNISKLEKKRSKVIENKKNSIEENDYISHKEKTKFNRSEILILSQMIE